MNLLQIKSIDLMITYFESWTVTPFEISKREIVDEFLEVMKQNTSGYMYCGLGGYCPEECCDDTKGKDGVSGSCSTCKFVGTRKAHDYKGRLEPDCTGPWRHHTTKEECESNWVCRKWIRCTKKDDCKGQHDEWIAGLVSVEQQLEKELS